MACYLNIGIFSATQLFLYKREIDHEQTVVNDVSTCISEIITIILLLAVLAYHGYTEVCSKGLKKCKWKVSRYDERIRRINDDLTNYSIAKQTFSVVKVPQHSDNTHSALIKHSEQGQRSSKNCEQSCLVHHMNYDTASTVSEDSDVALLD